MALRSTTSSSRPLPKAGRRGCQKVKLPQATERITRKLSAGQCLGNVWRDFVCRVERCAEEEASGSQYGHEIKCSLELSNVVITDSAAVRNSLLNLTCGKTSKSLEEMRKEGKMHLKSC